MDIALVAMSGVRVADQELLELGLSLPGFVERSKVIASLPSLSLLTLAALTPPQHHVSYHEVRDLTEAPGELADKDLVAISSYTAQIPEAYELAERLTRAGVAVVMGGLHVTALPEEAKQHCTTVVLGEGEASWRSVIEDCEAGALRPTYGWPGFEFDLAQAPVPRFDLLDLSRYNRLTVQTSRGCPHRCEFCASSVLLTKGYRLKPPARVLAEIRRVKELWEHPFIELADDNSLAARGHAAELLAGLRELGVQWFAECDIAIARDVGLLDAMRESGCRMVLIGLESPTAPALDGIELRANWKLKQLPEYAAAVQRIQERGIAVIGCFVLGLDHDTPDVFDRIYAFADQTALFDVQLTVMTPFPGTPLYERLRHEGRLLHDGSWERWTLFDVNYVPLGMTPEQLRAGLIELGQRVYDAGSVDSRRRRFFQGCRRYRRGGGSREED